MSGPSLAARSTPSDRTVNRITGLAVASFAAAMWVWIIPWQVDSASYGWMRPRTLPSICVVGLGAAGLLVMLFPGGATDIAPRRHLKAAGLLALAAAALWAMGRWGFIWTAPVLAALLVATLRERRPVWIAATVLAVPLGIWLAVEQLLGRTLP